MKKIKNALISVYAKEGLEPIVRKLDQLGVSIYSTGGTYDFLLNLGIKARTVESLTSYPSILGGRVKTLHPKVFGGILARRENPEDQEQMRQFDIPAFDLVMVDLYPFEKTVASGASEADIIEKIDIGGISLIRAAAKNFKDVMIIPSVDCYQEFYTILEKQNGSFSLEQRRYFATLAFHTSSHYDTAIFNYFNQETSLPYFKESTTESKSLRYGENPHQKGIFFGNINNYFDQLNGKEISYNNLLDIDAAICLIEDFKEPTFAVIKHNNACGLATRENITQAWVAALVADPVSAYGGILVTNCIVDEKTALEINKLFFEVLIAPGFENNALETLKSKKNRIILQRKKFNLSSKQIKTVLNGFIQQERDTIVEQPSDMTPVTLVLPDEIQYQDLAFANILVKHTKSNAIVLVKNKQLLASGVGQTSRVDALKQAIEKAHTFGFDLNDAVMASDAFFPFADCVEIAHKAGIKAVIQPGGSVRDEDSINYCNDHGIAMVFTGNRHFKH